MNKELLESQEAVLYSTPLMLSIISTLSGATSQAFQKPQTLQRFLSPLYTVTVFVLLWLNGPCELCSMVRVQGLFNICKQVQSISQQISEHQSA